MLGQFLCLRDEGIELLAQIGAVKFNHLGIGLRSHHLGEQVERSVAVCTRGLDHFEAVARTALGRRRIGVFKNVGCLLGSTLDLLVIFLGLSDALFRELAEGRRNLEVRHFELGDLKLRHFESWGAHGDRLWLGFRSRGSSRFRHKKASFGSEGIPDRTVRPRKIGPTIGESLRTLLDPVRRDHLTNAIHSFLMHCNKKYCDAQKDIAPGFADGVPSLIALVRQATIHRLEPCPAILASRSPSSLPCSVRAAKWELT